MKTLGFGKYRGKQLDWIYDKDPQYLEWLWKTSTIPIVRQQLSGFYTHLGKQKIKENNKKNKNHE